MIRKLQRMMSLLVALMVTFALSAQTTFKLVDESFENGIPETWTQEQVFGDFSWTVESGELTRPAGTVDGEKRIAFRNTGTQKTGAVTRLIMPMMDVSAEKILNPILCFAHAQDYWTGDFDVLKVLYRTGADKPWVTLKEYDKHYTKWHRDTLHLQGACATYQLAFEATDNLGRGIVIDDVEIRSMPNCLVPFAITALNVEGEKATIGWGGSFDAETFHIKIDTVQLDATTLASEEHKAAVVDTLVSGSFEFTYDKFELGTTYNVYIKSNCQNESSAWSAAYTFTTPIKMALPYEENFNMEYEKNLAGKTEFWAYQIQDSLNTAPFVNALMEDRDRATYAQDASTVLMFVNWVQEYSYYNYYNPYEAVYAMAVTPEIYVDDIRNVELSFTTINPSFSSVFCKIIVGVMEDQYDKTKFVAVDTISVRTKNEFERHYVSFKNYTGTGKYIAFLSEFTETNQFVIDDLKVDLAGAAPGACLYTNLIGATSVAVEFEAESEKYEVLFSKTEIADLDNYDASTVIAKTFDANNSVVDDLEESTEYYVYGRHVNGDAKGEWATVRKVRTHMVMPELPYTADFEIAEDKSNAYAYFSAGSNNWCLTNDLYLTENYSDWESYGRTCVLSAGEERLGYTETQGVLFASATADYYAPEFIRQAIVFPELKDRNNTSVSFFVYNHDAFDGQEGRIYVAFISNLNDVTSATIIDTISGIFPNQEGYFTYDLAKYPEAEGNFFAFVLGKSDYATIDNVRFFETPTCKNPENIVVTPDMEDGSKVTINWGANGAASWEVRISEHKYTMAQMDDATFEGEWVYNQVVNEAKAEITGLNGDGYLYYYYIRSLCDGGADKGIWTVATPFNTAPILKTSLPYSINFDRADWQHDRTMKGFPIKSLFTEQVQAYSSNTSFYSPCIDKEVGVNGTSACYLFGFYSWEGTSTYIALPKMDIDSVKRLQVSFQFKACNVNSGVSVGVMSDPNDKATYKEVAVIMAKDVDNWYKHVVTFDTYAEGGEYITFSVIDLTGDEITRSYYDFYLDNIVVDYISECRIPSGLKVDAAEATTAQLAWDKGSASEWNVVVASRPLAETELPTALAGANDVVYAAKVSSPYLTLEGLAESTNYHFYVQALCGEDEVSDWSAGVAFATACSDMALEQFTVETFAVLPACYIFNCTGEPKTATDYIPALNEEYSTTDAALRFHSLVEGAGKDRKSYGSYAMTPALALEEGGITALRARFSATAGNYTTSVYAHKLIVGIVTNPYDQTTLVPIDTIELESNWVDYEIRFDQYDGDDYGEYGRRIYFLSEFDKENYAWIDNLVIEEIPECVSPRVVADAITAESITLTLSGKQSQFELAYADRKFDIEDASSYTLKQVAAGEALTIDGLRAGKTYYFVGRSVCADGQYSDWGAMEIISTACAEKLAVPYRESFDNNQYSGTYYQPSCWTAIFDNADYQYIAPYVDANGYYDKGVRMMEGTAEPNDWYGTTQGRAYLISPEIDVENLNTLQVSFQLKPEVGYYDSVYTAFAVAVCEDPELYNSFVVVDTIYQWSYEGFREHIVSLAGYEGTGKHIMFFPVQGTSIAWRDGGYQGYYGDIMTYAEVVVDNIVIEEINACQRPTNVEFKYVEDVRAAFSFDYEGTSNFEVQYGPQYFNPENNEGTTVAYTTTDIVVEGLTPLTTYDFYLRAKCSDTEASSWTYMSTQTTFESYIGQFPYNCDFEDATERGCWGFLAEGQPNQWVFGTAKAAGDAGYALYVSQDKGATATYKYLYDKEEIEYNDWGYQTGIKYIGADSKSFAYRAFKFEEGSYNISFDWTGEAEVGTDYVKVVLVPLAETYVAGSEFIGTTPLSQKELVGTNYIDLSANVVEGNTVYTLAGATDWRTQSQSFRITADQAGLYRVVFYWVNNHENGGNSVVIDNFNVTKATCELAYDVFVDAIAETAATLSWAGAADSYNVVVLNTPVNNVDEATADQIVYNQVATDKKVELTGLTGITTYYLYLQAVCGEDKGNWSKPFVFETPAPKIGIGTVIDFESENVYYPEFVGTTENTKYPMLKGWKVGGQTGDYTESSAQYMPYVAEGGLVTIEDYYYGSYEANVSYSRSGDHALRSYAYADYNYGEGSSTGSYVVLPELKDEAQKRQVSFWIRPVSFEDGYANLGWYIPDPTVVVGTMTNPNDASTFVEITTVKYPSEIFTETYFAEDSDPEGANYWRRFVVSLVGAKGKYIAFRFDGSTSYYASPEVYIDDIEIDELQECYAPQNYTLANVTSTTVEISSTAFGEGETANIIFATDDDLANIVKTVEAVELPYKVEGLSDGTHYYVALQKNCDNGMVSGYSEIQSFYTNHKVPYSELLNGDFNTKEGEPLNNWTKASQYSTAYYGDYYNYTAPNVDLYDVLRQELSPTPTDGLYVYGWGVSENPIGVSEKFATRSIGVTNILSSAHAWAISPSVELIGNDENKYHLTFNAALTSHDYGMVDFTREGVSSEFFFVVVSADNGATWDIENGVMWCDTIAGAKQYSAIPYSGETMRIDLSRYAGKTIKVGFVHNGYSRTVVNVNDVRINAYTDQEIQDASCETADYEGEYVQVTADRLVVGENHLEYTAFGERGTENPDTLYNINLVVTPMIETVIEDAMCASDVYSKHNFKEITRAGVYRQKHVAANGCDSVVTLNLLINQVVETMAFDTICSGYVYDWEGLELTETGIYSQTFAHPVTGCDSVVILSLHVKDPIITEVTEVLCFGETYMLGDKEIKESGSYTETLQTAEGCDSIVNLNVIVRPDYRKVITATICEGDVYDGGGYEGFEGLSQTGSYPLKYTSVDGCDSTITLNLTVLSTDTTEVAHTITTDDLPYEYESLYFDENTEPGVYVDTIEVESETGDCKSVIIYTLTVEAGTAVDNVSVLDLTLVPNPVMASQTLYVGGEFSIEERNGLVVEIYNAIGQKVYVDAPQSYPIQVSGLQQRGVYIVKVTTGTGTQYQGKVIVK